MTLRIDHVVYGVHDLEAAAARFREVFGLVTTPGGTHPRWGTANRIASLGGARYLELIAIGDPAVAATTALGRAIAERVAGGDRWFALCLADDAIDDTATRLGLAVTPGSRTRPDGAGEVGLARRGDRRPGATHARDLPFFITWDGPGGRPPRARFTRPSIRRGARDASRGSEIAGDA